jgi:VanZ family protein
LKNYRFFWLALAWFIIVTVLLSLPGSTLPKEDWLDKIWFDKWVHIFLFGMLVWLFCFSFRDLSGKKIRLFLSVAIACFLYGIAMEFVQKYFIPDRSFDIGDILADGVGSGIGVFIASRMYIKK